jgi:hypothetical protein
MSQSERILYFLSEGNTITPLEALRMFNCFRLASRIAEIKAQLPQGQTIITNIKETYTDEGVKRYAEYKLRVDVLEGIK